MQTNAIEKAFDKAAYTYDRHAILQQEVGELLISRLNTIPTPINILDVGCGTGKTTQILADRQAHQHFDAIDLSNFCIELAKQRSAKQHIHYQQADFNHYQTIYPYDLIFSNMSLQWSDNLLKTFIILKQNLHAKGIIHFSLPLNESLETIHDFSFYQLPSEKDIAKAIYHAELFILSKKLYHYELIFSNLYDALSSLKRVGACYSNKKKNHTFISRQNLFENKPVSLHYLIANYTLRKQHESFYYRN